MVKMIESWSSSRSNGWHQGADYLKELDVCVEQVSLCDMNSLHTKLMNKAQDPGSDHCFSANTASSTSLLRVYILQALHGKQLQLGIVGALLRSAKAAI